MQNITLSHEVQNFIMSFSNLPEVEAIMLAGSQTTGKADPSSDYDFYIYTNSPVPLESRLPILQKHCKYVEPNNTFWETEDNGTLNCGSDFDLVYRNINDFFGFAKAKNDCMASVGYSTCLWANVMNSVIIFDRSGKGKDLQTAFGTDYPDKLAENIIAKNRLLLSGTMPAYDHQIAKAVRRSDIVNVHNRIDAFLTSYFDILFALNRIPHPGEKRQVTYLSERETLLPHNFTENVSSLLNCSPTDERIMDIVDRMVKELDKIL